MKKYGGWTVLALALAGAVYGFTGLSSDSEDTRIPNPAKEEEKAESEADGAYEYGVSSDHPQATEIGMDVLDEGGTAVDAAVAVSYALGTLEPHSSGIGGGGVMLVQEPEEEPEVYDYRTIAPESGPVPDSGAGVPGFAAGMEKVHADFGSLSIKELIKPSIDLAEEGFTVDEVLEKRLTASSYRLPVKELPQFYPEGTPLREGEQFKQEELAETMQTIADEGAEAFYEGDLAGSVAEDVGGLEEEDFASYDVLEKTPVKGNFYGYDVYAPPAPSGGAMFIQSLEVTELLDLTSAEGDPEQLAYALGETNRRAHKEHQEYVGDPAFTDVPEEKLVEEDHMKELAATIEPGTLQEDFQSPLVTKADEDNHQNTTHAVIVDDDGTMVSFTNTISNFFGDGIYTNGFFMTNQLRNFSSSEDSPNSPEKGKRSNSYMVPSILSYEGRPVIGIGSAGGRRIPSVVTQVLTRAVVFEETFQKAVDAPRFYLDVFEDTFYTEEGFEMKPEAGEKLIAESSPIQFGSINGLFIEQESKTVHGAADSRRGGAWSSAEKEK
ncbi:gamma-glutamyltransferase family protein [Alkalicoccus halolimnae]|uniref:Gamma-glutamyltransferase n=1 Tax=Alkalicoccus halolimnae TaxID=1667239 RepID=A0AAJ8LR36_9BACI|nr:gamma-glutamyltransferase [Alkalicoccus halolimnae]